MLLERLGSHSLYATTGTRQCDQADLERPGSDVRCEAAVTRLCDNIGSELFLIKECMGPDKYATHEMLVTRRSLMGT